MVDGGAQLLPWELVTGLVTTRQLTALPPPTNTGSSFPHRKPITRMWSNPRLLHQSVFSLCF